MYQNGKTVRGSLTSLKYAPNPHRSSYRLAVVVSKKVSKSAVVRNRIRRRIYEAFRRRESEFKGPHDMIVTVFGEQMAAMSSEDLEKIMSKLLHEANVT